MTFAEAQDLLVAQIAGQVLAARIVAGALHNTPTDAVEIAQSVLEEARARQRAVRDKQRRSW